MTGRAVTAQAYTGVKFVPVTVLRDINTLGQGAIWDFARSGTTLYAAASSDGIYVFDLTNPEAPVQGATIPFRDEAGNPIVMPVTDVYIMGTVLYACGRSIDWTESNQTGICAAYDISTTPLTPTWLDSHQHPEPAALFRSPDTSSTGPFVAGNISNHWFQGMTDDGTYLVLASQRGGATVLDVSNIATTGFAVRDTFDWYDLAQAIAVESGTHNGGDGAAFLQDTTKSWTVDEWNPSGAGTGYQVINLTSGIMMRAVTNTSDRIDGYLSSTGTLEWNNLDQYVIIEPTAGWETSRVTHAGGWLFFADHGQGVTALQSAAGILSNPQVYGAFVAPRIAPNTGNIQLRPRDVVTDGTYIFVCCNISKDGVDALGNSNKDGPERGLLMMDVTTPATNDNSDWYNTPIGFAGRERWDGAGDQPHLGLCQEGDYVYIGNGIGVAVFDVSTRTAPVYLGTHGSPDDPASTTIYAPYIYETGGKTYIYYGDALETEQKHNLYVEEVKFY